MPNERPYPGIRPFEENEREFFFGRDDQIKHLKDSLTKNFVAVIGSSGSGKSSLVKAGLIPELKNLDWVIGVMKPQRSPIENLISMITGLNWEYNIDETFRKAVRFNINLSSDGIVETYSQSLSDKKLLLIVDQFEELFSFKDEQIDNKTNPKNVEEALKFVNLLVNAAKSEEPICILITMRSEFLGNCADFKGLPKLINEGQFLIPRLTRAQFKEAIVKPVEKLGVSISPALVSQMLNDIEFDPDQLPVLQHALMRMWNQLGKIDKTKGAIITQDTYQFIGGMQNAINKHANEILAELSQQGLLLETQDIFQRITKKSPMGVGVRNRQTLAELVAVTNSSSKKVRTIVDAFRAEGVNFLLPPPKELILETTDIDIAHETLIRKWSILNDWIQKEDEDKRMLMRLIDREQEFYTDKKNFLRGSVLNSYLNWSKYKEGKQKKTINWSRIYTSRFSELIEFINTSVKENDSLEQQEAKKKRRLKAAIISAVAVSLISLLAIYLIQLNLSRERRFAKQAREAQKEAVVAQKEAEKAQKKAEKARKEAEIERERAIIAEIMALKEKAASDVARKEAEKQRGLADEARKEAERQRQKANFSEDKVKEQQANSMYVAEQAKHTMNGIRMKFFDDSVRYNTLVTETQTIRDRGDVLQREYDSLSKDYAAHQSNATWAFNTADLLLSNYSRNNFRSDAFLTTDERQLVIRSIELFAKQEASSNLKFKVGVYSYTGEKSDLAQPIVASLKKENITTDLVSTINRKWPPMTILYFKNEHVNYAFRVKRILAKKGFRDFRFQLVQGGKGDPGFEVIVMLN